MENPTENLEAECPLCLSRMELEEQAGTAWLICPNGCPTEIEVSAQQFEAAAELRQIPADADVPAPKQKTAVA